VSEYGLLRTCVYVYVYVYVCVCVCVCRGMGLGVRSQGRMQPIEASTVLPAVSV
jgi:hypothetical protein